MEKKNIVFIAKSLDGYIAGKNGELDWLFSVPNPDNVETGFGPLMDEIDAVVMGKNTFDFLLGYEGDWPYAKPVFVLSNSLKTVPECFADKVSLLSGNPPEVLKTIHARGCYKLYIDGGRTIQSFLDLDLIDELRITTIPILLGGGAPLFGDLSAALMFEHVKTEVFLGALVQSWYRRKR
jgi:dihydrofolate reductase